MSDTYYVKTFGGLEITNDNVTVNIVELFGKQLVNLLQVLLFHSEKPVQKFCNTRTHFDTFTQI